MIFSLKHNYFTSIEKQVLTAYTNLSLFLCLYGVFKSLQEFLFGNIFIIWKFFKFGKVKNLVV